MLASQEVCTVVSESITKGSTAAAVSDDFDATFDSWNESAGGFSVCPVFGSRVELSVSARGGAALPTPARQSDCRRHQCHRVFGSISPGAWSRIVHIKGK